MVSASDKFRGTLTAAEFGTAVAAAAARAGATAETVPMADGGEGLLEVFGGANRLTEVTDALGRPVAAAWRLDGDIAVVESARSNGLELVGGAAGNDPERASTRGVGELLAAVLATGPRRVVVGVGGSATTDGGLGAIEVLAERDLLDLLARTEVVVACDVTTRYADAATVFGPQKGAEPEQVARLTERLHETRRRLIDRFGRDPDELAGAGAAGGLAGGLAVLGARLEPGVRIVADHVGLDAALGRADLVVTGEGRLDRTSLQGKVVGEVAARAAAAGQPVLVVCGIRDDGVEVPAATVVSLVERFGRLAAMTDTARSVRRAVAEHLRGMAT